MSTGEVKHMVYSSTSPRIYAQTLALSGLIIAIFLACSLYMTEGHFTYPIDDTYIHLAIASLLPGQYGTTAGIPAAASSSIIYPWLLVPFADFLLAPLFLNLVPAAISLWLLCRISGQLNLTNLYPTYATGWLVAFFALATNIYTMLLLGMEHSLHITTVLAVLSALIDLNENKPLPKWFWAALVLMPMIRYEGIALFGLTLLWLLTTRYRLAAVLVGATETAIQLAHAAYLHSLDLPLVAGSVLIKTDAINGAEPFQVFLERVVLNLLHPQSSILIILLVFLSITMVIYRNRIALLAMLCILAHILGGRVIWSDRYHSYLLAFGFIALLYTLRPAILTIKFSPASRCIWAFAFMLCFYASLLTTAKMPYASQDIYWQQVQYTRLIKNFWQGPVGANDIGYLSWQNPYQVHDIFGLGSEEVRQLRAFRSRWNQAALADYATRHGVSLFILYDPWFTNQIPASWSKVGEFSFNRDSVVVAHNRVSLYLANPAEAERLEKALSAWEKTLPAGTTLVKHQPE